MFCPNCGQEKLSPDTNFCSRCGFLLTGTLTLLESGGNPQPPITGVSPRNRGLKQGLFIFLLTFLVIPIIAILTLAIDAGPFAIAISAISLFVGGLLRMAYAVMFEEPAPKAAAASDDFLTAAKHHLSRRSVGALQPLTSVPADAYAAPGASRRRGTSDLQPASVTDGTTKLLDDSMRDQ